MHLQENYTTNIASCFTGKKRKMEGINEEIELTLMEIKNLQQKVEILQRKKKRLEVADIEVNHGLDRPASKISEFSDIEAKHCIDSHASKIQVQFAQDDRAKIAGATSSKLTKATVLTELSKELETQSNSEDNLSHNGKPDKKRYYVIYDEPYQGILTNKFEALRIIQGNPGIKHMKFNSSIEAEGSLAAHRSKRIERNSYLRTLANEPVPSDKMVSLGIKFRSSEENEEAKTITFQQWKLFANIIRKNDGSGIDGNKYFSSDYGRTSRYILLEGINSKLCYQLFLAGLVDTIYPGKELRELDYFPRNFQKAVKNFKKRALKNSDRDIFLSICSSIPVWEEDTFLSPYHFIRLGTKACDQSFQQPRTLEAIDYQKEDLVEERAQSLQIVYNDARRVMPKMEQKANYRTRKILMISFFNNPISEEDYGKVRNFQNKFVLNRLEANEETRRGHL